MWRMATIFALAFTAPSLAADAWPVAKFNGWQGAKPQTPCECRHRTGKAMLGEKICLTQNGKMVTMQCTKVLNNTAWRKVGEGCDVADLGMSVKRLN